VRLLLLHLSAPELAACPRARREAWSTAGRIGESWPKLPTRDIPLASLGQMNRGVLGLAWRPRQADPTKFTARQEQNIHRCDNSSTCLPSKKVRLSTAVGTLRQFTRAFSFSRISNEDFLCNSSFGCLPTINKIAYFPETRRLLNTHRLRACSTPPRGAAELPSMLSGTC